MKVHKIAEYKGWMGGKYENYKGIITSCGLRLELWPKQTAHHWRRVTCKKCLKKRPPVRSDDFGGIPFIQNNITRDMLD